METYNEGTFRLLLFRSSRTTPPTVLLIPCMMLSPLSTIPILRSLHHQQKQHRFPSQPAAATCCLPMLYSIAPTILPSPESEGGRSAFMCVMCGHRLQFGEDKTRPSDEGVTQDELMQTVDYYRVGWFPRQKISTKAISNVL